MSIPPIGPTVATAPASRPDRVRLPGRFVSVRPLEPGDADALFETVCGPARDALWAYLFDGPFHDRAEFGHYVTVKAASADPLFYAIEDNRTGRPVGHAALMRSEPNHRVVEVGSILYGTSLRRTPGATESMALLAGYVFDTLGYRRYEWKCNDLNAPSKNAAERLGFRFEGVFRQHMVVKGRNRDTAWFSILDSEWPACRVAFEAWLSPSNFDQTGAQRRSLASLRGRNGTPEAV